VGIEQGSNLLATTDTMNTILTLIQNLEAGSLLTRPQAESLMEELLCGRIDTTEIVRMLQALNSRPVDAGELASFARVMRQHAALVFPPGVALPEKMVDTCGTGGDGSGTFNISTAAAIVASAAGARVAKHGNRSISSRCGSADVLEVLGIRIDLPLEHAGRAIREIGIGFLFAPTAHAATRHVIPARKQIARHTVFNLLGPLTNPAGSQRQVLGVFSADVVDLVAATLAELGVERALVVHGAGGLDEISPAGETQIAEVRAGTIRRYTVSPEDFRLQRAPLHAIRGGTPEENAKLIRELLEGERGAPHDAVVMNASAALVVTDNAADFRSGAEMAAKAIASGAAKEKLRQLVSFVK
jgi:anthranilate phosphoribosyltransferase